MSVCSYSTLARGDFTALGGGAVEAECEVGCEMGSSWVCEWKAQEALWKLLERGDLQLVPLDEAIRSRTRTLMSKYRDPPMDLADASLVAVAEELDVRRIFTLDRGFRIYRWKGKRKFEVVP
jgi:hypothetical protein